jgi:hypothetical protein
VLGSKKSNDMPLTEINWKRYESHAHESELERHRTPPRPMAKKPLKSHIQAIHANAMEQRKDN